MDAAVIDIDALKAAYVAANTDHAKVRADLIPLVIGRRHWVVLSADARRIIRDMQPLLVRLSEAYEPSDDNLFTAVLATPFGPLLLTVLPKDAVTAADLAEALGGKGLLRMEENLVAVDVVVVGVDDDHCTAVRDWFHKFLVGESNAG